MLNDPKQIDRKRVMACFCYIRHVKEHNNMDDCEQPEWTIFSETVKEKGSEHCGVTTGGKSMQKRDTWWWNTTVQEAIATKKRKVQEVATIESTIKSCHLQRGKERRKENRSS